VIILPLEGETRCWDGKLYRFVPLSDVGGESSQIVLLSEIRNELIGIKNILDSNSSPATGYRFQKLTIPANSIKYEITISPPARIMVVTSESPVTINLYDRSGDEIEIRGIDWPFETPVLPKELAIERIYISTTVETVIRILSFG